MRAGSLTRKRNQKKQATKYIVCEMLVAIKKSSLWTLLNALKCIWVKNGSILLFT